MTALRAAHLVAGLLARDAALGTIRPAKTIAGIAIGTMIVIAAMFATVPVALTIGTFSVVLSIYSSA